MNALPAIHDEAIPAAMPERIFSQSKVDLIRKAIMPDASDLEFQTFLDLCKVKRLDPITRQIYAIKQKGGTWQTFASIDGLRVIAERSGQYAGQTAPMWCGEDGKWMDVWLGNGSPAAAKVGVLRKDWQEPMWGVARFKSYGKTFGTWATMPDVMLAKCAEAIALRKAFPDDLSALYVREEFDAPDMPETPPDAPTGHLARPAAMPATAESVDQDTGEIKTDARKALDVPAMIREKRTELGWTVEDVLTVADVQGYNLRTLDGNDGMWRYLIDLSAVMDSINDTGKQMGWNAREIDEQAQLGGFDLKNLEHAKVFWHEMNELKRSTLDGPEDEGEPEQGTLLEAEYKTRKDWD